MYSPNIPNNIMIIPPTNKITVIVDEYPSSILGFTNFLIIMTIASTKPTNALIPPQKVAKRNGLTEKAVNPFIHNPNNLKNVYPDFPC